MDFSWSATVVADDPFWYRGGPADSSPIPGVEFPSDGWLMSETGLPATSGGMSFPFSFPFAFDAVTVSGEVAVTAARGGWWVFQIVAQTQPLVNPAIYVVAPDLSVRRLMWRLTLNPGESLIVDPQRQTALLEGTASRPPAVREWTAVPSGSSLVQFRAGTESDGLLRVYFIPAQ